MVLAFLYSLTLDASDAGCFGVAHSTLVLSILPSTDNGCGLEVNSLRQLMILCCCFSDLAHTWPESFNIEPMQVKLSSVRKSAECSVNSGAE